MSKRKMNGFAYLRLLMSGALLGMAFAGFLGFDLSEHLKSGVLSGAAGAAVTAVLLKISAVIS